MPLRVTPYVTVVDLSAEGVDFTPGFDAFQRSQLPLVRGGLVDISRVLVVGSEEEVRCAQETMAHIIVAPSVERSTLCVVFSRAHDAGAADGPVRLPIVLERDTVGVIWVGDPRGVLWQPGSAKTRALTVSRSDPHGESVLAALTDVLRAPEVFDAVFDATRQTKTASSPGLRLLVPDEAMGLLGPGEHAAVEEVTGARNSQRAASITAPSSEREPNLSILLGEAPADADLVAPEGEIGLRVTAAKHALASAQEAVEAVLDHPLNAQTTNVRDCITAVGESLGDLKQYLKRELLEVIDGSKGINQDQIQVLRRVGLRTVEIRPAPDVNADDSEDRLRELVSEQLLSSRSLLAVAGELRALSAKARPRSSAQTVATLDIACPDRLVKELREFSPMLIHLGGLRPMIALFTLGAAAMCLPALWMVIPSAALALIPLLLVRASAPARQPAEHMRMHVERATQAVAFLVLGGLAGVFLNMAVGSRTLATVALAAVPIACLYFTWAFWRQSIRRWTDDARLSESSQALNAIIELTASVTINDCVLANPRVRYARTAARLADSLQEICVRLLGELAPVVDDPQGERMKRRAEACNPAIRMHHSEATGATLLSYASTVRDIIADDYADLITQAVEEGWVDVVAGPDERGKVIVSRAFADLLEDYRRNLRNHGLFRSSSSGIAIGDDDIDNRGGARLELLAQIWRDTEGLEELLSIPIESELVQLCAPHHLLLLDEDPAGAHIVRFEPNGYLTSRRDSATIPTSSMLLAGVMRLVRLRAGTVLFEQ